ncbi:hypothetical protein OAB81_00705 [Flavobacteriaceae bacterium]|nr:hypothetical protein [Flavobacteriaceae bacterium]
MKNILYLYSNSWQKKNFEAYSKINYSFKGLLIAGFYNHNDISDLCIIRKNKILSPFSISDGIFNYYSIKKQFKYVLANNNIDYIFIDNPDRYVERILISLVEDKKIICFQHGFDPSEKLLNRNNKLFHKIPIFIRSLIFSKILTFKIFKHLEEKQSKFVLFSNYFKESYLKISNKLNVIVVRDPRFFNIKKITNKLSDIDKELIVFTGEFRYDSHKHKISNLFHFFEKSDFDIIKIKPKKGEEQIFKDFLKSNELVKKYKLLNSDLDYFEVLKNSKNIMCSIESTLTLQFRIIGFKSFYTYNTTFFKNSLIKKYNDKSDCVQLYKKDNFIISKVDTSYDSKDNFNYFFGLNENLLDINNL